MIRSAGCPAEICSQLSSWPRSLQAFTWFIWWMYSSAKQPPTLRPSHLTWAVSPPVMLLLSTTTITIYYYCSRNAVIASFDDWWPGVLRRCSARLEQLVIQRHCITDTWHLQAPAEDTSFRCFPYLTHLVLNLHCTVFFVTLTDVQCSWSFFFHLTTL